jgi:hypothetical protein
MKNIVKIIELNMKIKKGLILYSINSSQTTSFIG